jgi:hypothetical protein
VGDPESLTKENEKAVYTKQEFSQHLKGKQPNPLKISSLRVLESVRGRDPW